MKSSFKNQVNFALVITVLFFLVLSCDAWVHFAGKITDENGNPISNAKIIVEQGKLLGQDKLKVVVVESKENGSFQIHGDLCTAPLCSGTIKLTVIKEGFQDYEKSFSQKELGRSEIIIILKKS